MTLQCLSAFQRSALFGFLAFSNISPDLTILVRKHFNIVGLNLSWIVLKSKMLCFGVLRIFF